MSAPIVGIDLGTTFSLVAQMVEGRPALIPNKLGELLTPSAVALSADGELLVGAAARAQAVLRPEFTALAFKRDMGTNRLYQLGTTSFSPVQLSGLVLSSLRKDAEAVLGQPIEEAVVTVPAYFNDLQRQATRDAASMAGLRVERIINEPTAAALAYGLDRRGSSVHVAVLDLGGGTFDVTVLEVVERVVEIQSSAGDVRLGGEDFVSLLVDLVATRFLTSLKADLREVPLSHARLRSACERLMHRLSVEEVADVSLPDALGTGEGSVARTVVSRAEAEEVWQPLLRRLEHPVRVALRDARMHPQLLDEVLLVGGASRIPCVGRLFEELFERPPLRTLHPDQSVALGAAIQGALKAQDGAVDDLVVTDIAPFTLGIRSGTHFGQRYVGDVFSPILERGTVVPASRVERFTTAAHNQPQIRIDVFQGEHSVCAQNTYLGQYVFHNVPPGPAGTESLDVRFTYDLNGLLDVEVTLVSENRTESFVIEGRPGALTPGQLQDARRALARFKVHPRDALPNATALARAEASFVELTGEARQVLGRALAQFRAALEGQEPRAIEEARRVLIAVTKSLQHD